MKGLKYHEIMFVHKIEKYPLSTKAIKDVLKENKFPIHKIIMN